MYNRLDIYWVDLEPTKGAETKKKRPCVILQASMVNQNSRTVIVAPLLPDHKTWPFAVNLKPSPKNGLDKDRHINLKQLRAVDVSRLSNQQGSLEGKYDTKIIRALKLVLEIS